MAIGVEGKETGMLALCALKRAMLTWRGLRVVWAESIPQESMMRMATVTSHFQQNIRILDGCFKQKTINTNLKL